jgi:hypothetical protein
MVMRVVARCFLRDSGGRVTLDCTTLPATIVSMSRFAVCNIPTARQEITEGLDTVVKKTEIAS